VRKLLAVSLVLISFNANAVQYQVQQLPNLSAVNFSSAYALNDNGRIVGQSFNASTGQLYAVTWDSNGSIQSLGVEGLARGVNNSGTVVGESGSASVQNPTGQAFMWSGSGPVTYIGDLGGPYSGAYDINESGVITGYSMTNQTPAGGEPVHGSRAFRYDSVTSTMTDLGTVSAPDGYSRGHGINDAGEIAGRASLLTFPTGQKHLATWDPSNNITSIPNSGSSIYSTAQQINNSGEIVGNGIDSNGEWLGMVWDENGNFSHWLDTFGGDQSRAWSINDDGTIVGFGTNGAGQGRALVSYDGGATSEDLNNLVVDMSEWQYLTTAFDINASGQIVGVGLDSNGFQSAFIATVVPVPAAVWLFGSALGAFFGFGRLRGQRLQKS